MNKIIKCLLALLMAMCMLLVGCGEGDGKPPVETKPQTSTGIQTDKTTDTQETDSTREFIKLSKTSNLIMKVSNEYRETVNDFKKSVEMKTGLTLRMTNSSTVATSFEIIVGKVTGRSESVAFYDDISYAECAAEIRNGKLVVGTFAESMLEAALSAVSRAIVKNDGEWGIWSDFSYSESVVDIQDSIPKFDTKSGTMVQGVKSNDGFQIGYTGCTVSEYDAYCKELSDAGYTLHASNNVKQNKYSTYVTENTMAHLMWQGAISTFRMVVSPKGYIPSTEAPTYTKIKDATVAQLPLVTDSHGMLYVIQAEDGSFVVIDGGLNRGANKSTLLTYLKTNKPASHAKPHVTWILTPPHSDHIEMAMSFLESYSKEIHLDMISFNFPDVDALTWASDYTTTELKNYAKEKTQELWKLIDNKYKDAEIFIHHTGQKLFIPGAEIEFVFTQEDWWPNKCQTFNDTMSAFKITFKSGKSFFVTGDSDEAQCNLMAKVYGDYLRCDVFQATHHGQKGGTASLYSLLKPTYVFWANSKKKCTTTKGDIYTATIHHSDRSSFNPILFNDKNILGHFHGEQLTVINMTTMTATDGKGNTAQSFWPLS